jgi:hypothetical protein
VLEVGTGSGYQAAVLSLLAREVYSMEIVERLGREAEARLKQMGYANVHVRIGDGYRGWPEAAPFDAILVTAAPHGERPGAREPAARALCSHAARRGKGAQVALPQICAVESKGKLATVNPQRRIPAMCSKSVPKRYAKETKGVDRTLAAE